MVKKTVNSLFYSVLLDTIGFYSILFYLYWNFVYFSLLLILSTQDEEKLNSSPTWQYTIHTFHTGFIIHFALHTSELKEIQFLVGDWHQISCDHIIVNSGHKYTKDDIKPVFGAVLWRLESMLKGISTRMRYIHNYLKYYSWKSAFHFNHGY